MVSACHGAVVNVWQIDTGEKLIKFKVSEEESEITALAFDPTKRRLITGTRDGTILIWNFNNGACLRKVQAPDDSEVIRLRSGYVQIAFRLRSGYTMQTSTCSLCR